MRPVDSRSGGSGDQKEPIKQGLGGADNGQVRMQKGRVEKTRKAKSAGGKASSSAAAGQQAWLKFAKGGSSKKLKAKAINQRSIFKSPDTVTGKVGVANSGKGMTKTQALKRV
ncbi:hypothetical protein GGI12_000490 [Dipsacomyces acuminosporus]|nr:hypothetical protein GGI12_000490 [Dipsacomyces acuminosporus]